MWRLWVGERLGVGGKVGGGGGSTILWQHYFAVHHKEDGHRTQLQRFHFADIITWLFTRFNLSFLKQ